MDLTPPPQSDADVQVNPLLRLQQLQADLDHLHDELLRQHRLATLGTLACSIAHEFNNILTPVMNYAQWAADRPDQPDLTAKALRHAVEGCQRAARISEALLGFARQSQDPCPVPLREVVDQALACLARQPDKAGIEVQVDVPAVAAAMPAADLQQVLLNLLLNACQALTQPRSVKRAGVHGRISITATEDAGRITLTVRDNGPGIPPELIDRLFQPFTTTGGNGLGLAVCRDLLKMSGGMISVHNASDSGAVFSITIPAAK